MKRVLVAATLALGLVVGCSGGGGSSEGPVEVTAGDLYFEQDDARSTDSDLTYTAAAGQVEIVLDNQGATLHNVTVEEADDTMVAEASGGSSADGTIELDPGSYTIYCDVAGHREAGMEATLEVTN